MTINWILGDEVEETLHHYCVELEYKLRPKIVKFLISRLDPDCSVDFSCFQFDIDIEGRSIGISNTTPHQYYSLIEADFPKPILEFTKI